MELPLSILESMSTSVCVWLGIKADTARKKSIMVSFTCYALTAAFSSSLFRSPFPFPPSLPLSLSPSLSGVCNETTLCHNGGVCINSEDGKDYTCQCLSGFTGENCTLAQLQGIYTQEIVCISNAILFLQIIIIVFPFTNFSR